MEDKTNVLLQHFVASGHSWSTFLTLDDHDHDSWFRNVDTKHLSQTLGELPELAVIFTEFKNLSQIDFWLFLIVVSYKKHVAWRPWPTETIIRGLMNPSGYGDTKEPHKMHTSYVY